MSLQPILHDGAWQESENPVDTFRAVSPVTGKELPDEYPVSRYEDVVQLIEAGARAAAHLAGTPPEEIAAFLERYAHNVEARADDIAETAHLETGLAKSPRLADIELHRTTDQLRQAADAARNRTWCEATIDSEQNIRSMFEPLGAPVVVMGPNNFPLAFNGVAGGDFAAAIAAGNPVIAKAHPGHPETSKKLAEAAAEAAQQTDVPDAIVQFFYRTRSEDGLKMVAHPEVGATAFTGSRRAGLALKEAADLAGNPIYLEMSSTNPVFMLSGALQERRTELVEELTGSCNLGAGQFCTNPGLVVTPEGEDAEAFLDELAESFQNVQPGPMVGADEPGYVGDAVEVWTSNGAEVVVGGEPMPESEFKFTPTVCRTTGENFLKQIDELQTEAFGAASLVVFARDVEQMAEIAASLEGNLTGTIYSDTGGSDDEEYEQVASRLRTRVGRLLNDKMPTGVAVTPAMVHGGPYPATGHPGFTAVGIPASLRRFAARRCYDNVRPHRLPAELQDENPTGSMWRFIDREWSQGDVS